MSLSKKVIVALSNALDDDKGCSEYEFNEIVATMHLFKAWELAQLTIEIVIHHSWSTIVDLRLKKTVHWVS